jgi:hypothetical protein
MFGDGGKGIGAMMSRGRVVLALLEKIWCGGRRDWGLGVLTSSSVSGSLSSSSTSVRHG